MHHRAKDEHTHTHSFESRVRKYLNIQLFRATWHTAPAPLYSQSQFNSSPSSANTNTHRITTHIPPASHYEWAEERSISFMMVTVGIRTTWIRLFVSLSLSLAIHIVQLCDATDVELVFVCEFSVCAESDSIK